MHKTEHSLWRWTSQSQHRSTNHESFDDSQENFSLYEKYTKFWTIYSPSKEFKLVGYSDNDWAGDTDDRKSDSGFVFYMGDIAFAWTNITTSSVCHAIWLRNLLKELQMLQEKATNLWTIS